MDRLFLRTRGASITVDHDCEPLLADSDDDNPDPPPVPPKAARILGLEGDSATLPGSNEMPSQSFKETLNSRVAELKQRLIALDPEFQDQTLAAQELQHRRSISPSPLHTRTAASHELEMAGYEPEKDAAYPELLRNNLVNKTPSEIDPFSTLSEHRPDTANLHGQLLTEYTLELLDRTRIHDEVQEELRARWRVREDRETATQIAYELLRDMDRTYTSEIDTGLLKLKAGELSVKLTPAMIRNAVLVAFLERAEACGL